MTGWSFRQWNNVLGWAVFALAFLVYLSTVEPTFSFWDTGEYISSAVKLEVTHAPGAALFQQLSTAGLPFHFDTWQDYESYIGDMIATGVIDDVSENRWDIRPVPRFGTVEMRVCDGPSTLKEVGALAALTQCMVDSFSRALDEGETIPVLPPWHHQENKWRAARYGLDAVVIRNARNEQRPLAEDLIELLDRLEPVAHRLGCSTELAHVEDMVRGETGYRRQRRVAADNGGDLRAVVLDIVERNRTVR